MYSHIITDTLILNNFMDNRKRKEVIWNDTKAWIGFVVIVLLGLALFSCSPTPEPKRSDTEFMCKKIDAGDEDVDDWPNVLDGIEITQEKLDAAVEKMRPVSLMFVCMFAPEECKD